ncbi:hypothetical protein PLEOSDRAFT_1088236 [Pleurotus ostreatus PC15]|uniref:Uncharacterized protein n=1 Tax=Pleurotus ostreatus (strain PC15) TaxID=1137138 RepID=A0A067NVU6_PLEO1|nr:hypothetical protein PLEOSDRAFT_1088236 [Pleurotus ostreatus PC15]
MPKPRKFYYYSSRHTSGPASMSPREYLRAYTARITYPTCLSTQLESSKGSDIVLLSEQLAIGQTPPTSYHQGLYLAGICILQGTVPSHRNLDTRSRDQQDLLHANERGRKVGRGVRPVVAIRYIFGSNWLSSFRTE